MPLYIHIYSFVIFFEGAKNKNVILKVATHSIYIVNQKTILYKTQYTLQSIELYDKELVYKIVYEKKNKRRKSISHLHHPKKVDT